MTPDERDRIMHRVLAVWPTPKLADATVVIWHEHLSGMTYERLRAAVAVLERSSPRRPSLSDLHAAYAAEHNGRTPSAPPPQCSLCDDGFVSVRCSRCDCAEDFSRNADVCPKGYRTAARCPNGCVPMTIEEREAKWREDDARWDRERKRPRLENDALAHLVDRTMSTREQEEPF